MTFLVPLCRTAIPHGIANASWMWSGARARDHTPLPTSVRAVTWQGHHLARRSLANLPSADLLGQERQTSVTSRPGGVRSSGKVSSGGTAIPGQTTLYRIPCNHSMRQDIMRELENSQMPTITLRRPAVARGGFSYLQVLPPQSPASGSTLQPPLQMPPSPPRPIKAPPNCGIL